MSSPETTPETQDNGAVQATRASHPDEQYMERLRSDPEFAVSEINKAKGYGTRLFNEMKSMAPLKDIVAQVNGGAETVAQLIYEHAALQQHPAVKEVIQHYRQHGTLPTATQNRHDPSDDEYKDPVDSLRDEVMALREQLSTVTGSMNRDRTVIAHTAMQSHMQTLRNKYDAEWKVIEPFLIEQAEKWEKTPQGREWLANATLETWDNLAELAMGKNFDAVMQLRAEKRVQSKAGLGTEPSPTTVTSGREAPVQREEPFRPGMARRIIEEVRRREGRSV